MSCTHRIDTSGWQEIENAWTGEKSREWVESSQSLCEDIDIGRYRCTRCGLIMYYTGQWRDYHEKGTPL